MSKGGSTKGPDLKQSGNEKYNKLLSQFEKMVVITTDNSVDIFESAGKNIARLPGVGQYFQKTGQLSDDCKWAAWVENEKIHYQDLKSASFAPQAGYEKPHKDLFVIAGDSILTVDSKGELISFKFKGNELDKTSTPVKAPASCEKAKAVGLVSLNKGKVVVTYDNEKSHLFDASAGKFIHEDLTHLPKLQSQSRNQYCQSNNLILTLSAGAVIQYSIEKKGVTKQYSGGQYGNITCFARDKQNLYLATETHFLVSERVNNPAQESELLAALKLKFAAKNPGSMIYIDQSEPLKIKIVCSDKFETVELSPDWDKVEREPIGNNSQTNMRASNMQESSHGQHAQGKYRLNRGPRNDYDGQSYPEDEEEMEQDYKGKKKVTKKKKPTKKRKQSFDLNGMHHAKSNDYNALRDEHLKSYFYSYRIRGHLIKQNLITRDGYIIENPEEFRKNQKLFREHYRSQEVKKGKKKNVTKKPAKKGGQEDIYGGEYGSNMHNSDAQQDEHHGSSGVKDQQNVKKQEFDKFLNSVEKEIQKDQPTSVSHAPATKQDPPKPEAEKKTAEQTPAQPPKSEPKKEEPKKEEPKKVEPKKEEPKKEEPKKEEPKKEEPKKEEPKKEEPKKEEPKKEEPKKEEPKKEEPKKEELKKVEPKKEEPKKVEPKKVEPIKPADDDDF